MAYSKKFFCLLFLSFVCLLFVFCLSLDAELLNDGLARLNHALAQAVRVRDELLRLVQVVLQKHARDQTWGDLRVVQVGLLAVSHGLLQLVLDHVEELVADGVAAAQKLLVVLRHVLLLHVGHPGHHLLRVRVRLLRHLRGGRGLLCRLLRRRLPGLRLGHLRERHGRRQPLALAPLRPREAEAAALVEGRLAQANRLILPLLRRSGLDVAARHELAASALLARVHEAAAARAVIHAALCVLAGLGAAVLGVVQLHLVVPEALPGGVLASDLKGRGGHLFLACRVGLSITGWGGLC